MTLLSDDGRFYALLAVAAVTASTFTKGSSAIRLADPRLSRTASSRTAWEACNDPSKMLAFVLLHTNVGDANPDGSGDLFSLHSPERSRLADLLADWIETAHHRVMSEPGSEKLSALSSYVQLALRECRRADREKSSLLQLEDESVSRPRSSWIKIGSSSLLGAARSMVRAVCGEPFAINENAQQVLESCLDAASQVGKERYADMLRARYPVPPAPFSSEHCT